MAHAHEAPQRAGIVVGLCPDGGVYMELASAAFKRGLTSSRLRAAGTERALRDMESVSKNRGEEAEAWRSYLVRLEDPGTAPDLDADAEPLLCACFSCLSKLPGDGSPSQGSWRGNALADVIRALEGGGVILVVEVHTIGERRDWARALLKCGCAFVQTHEGGIAANA